MTDAKVPDWLRLQRQIFTRYVQQRLKEGKVHREVKDLTEDMKDGTLIVELIQVLSQKEYPHKVKQETMRIRQLENMNKVLAYVASVGVDTKKIRVQAEDIVDGKNEKIILALTFQIIYRFLKFEESGEDGKSLDVRDALMLWLTNKTAGYRDVKIDNFTKSFHSGLAFNALIHRLRPRLLNYDSLQKDETVKNLDQALDLAARHLNIEKYIVAADIPKMDELAMIVYLSDWYTGIFHLQKQDIAARRIGKLVMITELHDKMRAEYKDGAVALRAWVDKKIDDLNVRDFDDTLGGIQARLDAFYAYKKNEKGDKIVAHLDLSGLFNNIALRLHNHHRPAFVPPEGTAPADMDAKFDELEQAEAKRSVDLHNELARQLHLQKLFKRFKANSDKILAWAADKEKYFSVTDTINSVEDAEVALENCEREVGELKHTTGANLSDLSRASSELSAGRFEHRAEVEKVQENVSATFAGLEKAAADKFAALQAELKKQREINDQLCREFAGAVQEFTGWLKTKKAQLSAGEGGLEKQLEEVQALFGDAKEAAGRLEGVEAVDRKLVARSIDNNPHTNITLGDLQAQWHQYTLLLQKKQALLEEQIEEAKRRGLTKEQVDEIENNFNYFDADHSGQLDRKELKVCLQSLGEESRPQDVAAIMAEYDQKNTGHISKSEFQRFMFKQLGDTDTQEEITRGFNFLAAGKENILAEELQNVINDKSFKDHHVNYLLANIQPRGDGFDYTQWTGAAFAR